MICGSMLGLSFSIPCRSLRYAKESACRSSLKSSGFSETLKVGREQLKKVMPHKKINSVFFIEYASGLNYSDAVWLFICHIILKQSRNSNECNSIFRII